MIRRSVLLIARFLRLFRLPPLEEERTRAAGWPLVKQEQLAEYPALANDLAIWIEMIQPRFRQLDRRARILQGGFLRLNVVLILGGLAATCIGAVQAALGGRVVGLAIVQAILTGGLAGLAIVMRSLLNRKKFLSARRETELLKSEFLLFLGRTRDYNRPDAMRVLRQRVDDIETAEGAT